MTDASKQGITIAISCVSLLALALDSAIDENVTMTNDDMKTMSTSLRDVAKGLKLIQDTDNIF